MRQPARSADLAGFAHPLVARGLRHSLRDDRESTISFLLLC
jgi:hypothetical protein